MFSRSFGKEKAISGLQLNLINSPKIVAPFEMEHLPQLTFCKGVTPIPNGNGYFSLAISAKSFLLLQYERWFQFTNRKNGQTERMTRVTVA